MNHKTILVTGASRGIGKAIALTYARNGWDVVITCLRREEELKKTQREIEALGVSCLAWMGDAGDFESCSRLFDAIRERFGFLFINVDFPSPLAPTSPICSPFNNLNDTSSNIALSPNPCVRCSTFNKLIYYLHSCAY